MNPIDFDNSRRFLQEQIDKASTIEEKKIFTEMYLSLLKQKHDYDMKYLDNQLKMTESYNSLSAAQISAEANRFLGYNSILGDVRKNYDNQQFGTIRSGFQYLT